MGVSRYEGDLVDAVEDMEKENNELKAQLARCVEVITACDDLFKYLEIEPAEQFINSLPKIAKLDVEILRSAKAFAPKLTVVNGWMSRQFHDSHPEFTAFIDAVTAREDARCEKG